ncbi:MAG TPA: hypothetical protein VJ873_01885 [bacterium]|nr:hypothetical protein [bacterium]
MGRKYLKTILTGLVVLLWMAGPAKAAKDADQASSDNSSKPLAQRVKTLEDLLASYQTATDEKFKQVHEDQLRLHFNLYGDAEYRVFGLSGSFPQQNGFYTGQTDLHIMAQYGPHLGAMVENVVEFDGQNPSIDLERTMVYYTFSDQLRIAAGRDHTCFGYWNRTFHHGSQFQTTIDRPFFLAFEDGGGSDQAFKKGGVVPNHIVGLFAYGKFGLGASSLNYELNAGNNGNIGLNVDANGNATDSAINFNPSGGDNFNSKRFAGRLVLKPDANGPLAIGVASVLSHYSVVPSGPVSDGTPVFNDLAQLLLEGEVIYTDDNLELMGEFYNFDNATGWGSTNGTSNNTGYYVQLAYQATADLKPYVRVESLNVDGSDPFFRAMLSSNQTVYLAGIRYDMVPASASLKLELHLINNSGVNATEVATAWGWGF